MILEAENCYAEGLIFKSYGSYHYVECQGTIRNYSFNIEENGM